MAIERPTRSRLDSRLPGRPLDYFTRPGDFGRGPVRLCLPAGGTLAARSVALTQHHLATAYRQLPRGSRPSLRELAAAYGMSEATLGRVLSGRSWASATALVALLHAARSSHV